MLQFKLMQTKSFAQQAPGTRALHRLADFTPGNHAKPAARASGKVQPISDQAAIRDALALRSSAGEIASLLNPAFSSQPQFSAHRDAALKPASAVCVRPGGDWRGCRARFS